jgi:hypothetical protein
MRGLRKRLAVGVPALGVALAVLSGAGALPFGRVAAAQAASLPGNPAQLILDAQLPDGAITQWIDRSRIDPYLANYAAMGLAKTYAAGGDSRYLRAGWRWLSWYRTHMDAAGYVTDYTVGPGPDYAETSTGDMDSTDGYAGTFLLALRQTFDASGDTGTLRGFTGAIRKAVDAIRSTQQSDGLTWATPDYHAALLMDQAEAYAGLRAAAALATDLGMPSLAVKADMAAAAIRRAVAGLWQADGSAFAVARFEDGSLDRAGWNTYYPGATSQAWAVAVGNGLSPDAPLMAPARARMLMSTFSSRWPQWTSPDAQVAFDGGTHAVEYWPLVGGALVAVGQASTGRQGTRAIVSSARDRQWQWPFSVGAAGQSLLVSQG